MLSLTLARFLYKLCPRQLCDFLSRNKWTPEHLLRWNSGQDRLLQCTPAQLQSRSCVSAACFGHVNHSWAGSNMATRAREVFKKKQKLSGNTLSPMEEIQEVMRSSGRVRRDHSKFQKVGILLPTAPPLPVGNRKHVGTRIPGSTRLPSGGGGTKCHLPPLTRFWSPMGGGWGLSLPPPLHRGGQSGLCQVPNNVLGRCLQFQYQDQLFQDLQASLLLTPPVLALIAGKDLAKRDLRICFFPDPFLPSRFINPVSETGEGRTPPHC